MRPIFRSTLRAAMLATAFAGVSAPALACNTEPYIGSLCVFAFDWCPMGYLPADGRTLAIREYQGLFGLVGFRYGGDNATVFGIPDLRGRVAVGTGTGPGLTAPVALAQKFGQQTLLLNASQTPLPPHSHGSAFTPTSGSQTINVPASAGGAGVSVNTTAVTSASATTPTVANGSTVYLTNAGTFVGSSNSMKGLYTSTAPASGNTATIPVNGNPAFSFNVTSVTGGSVAVASASAPASQPISTQPPSIGMTACIAVQGLYPNRP